MVLFGANVSHAGETALDALKGSASPSAAASVSSPARAVNPTDKITAITQRVVPVITLADGNFKMLNKACFPGVTAKELRTFVVNNDFAGPKGYWKNQKIKKEFLVDKKYVDQYNAAHGIPMSVNKVRRTCNGREYFDELDGRIEDTFTPIGPTGPKFNVYQKAESCDSSNNGTSFTLVHYLGKPTAPTGSSPYLSGNMVWKITEQNNEGACINESFNDGHGPVTIGNEAVLTAIAFWKKFTTGDVFYNEADFLGSDAGHYGGFVSTAKAIAEELPGAISQNNQWQDPCDCKSHK